MVSTTASRKAKGRRLQQFIAAKILEAFPELHPEDVVSRPMGSPGSDIMLSRAAKNALGDFDIEAKNQESLNIWSALQQATERSKGDAIPVVIFKKNNSKVYVALDFEDWLALLVDLKTAKNIAYD